MALSREPVKIAGDLALFVDRRLGADLVKLVTAWSRAWRVVEAEWKLVTTELAREVAANGVPTKKTIRRARNVQAALNSSRTELANLAELTGGIASPSAEALIKSSAQMNARMIAAQLPKGSDLRAQVERTATLPNRQLEFLVRRSTARIESALRPLSDDATDAMLDALFQGAARGSNPRTMAAKMLEQARTGFDGGLTRALTISRTEALDGHRDAARAQQFQHSDVLDGWQWLADLTSRTCPACWSKHGSKHPLSELGPEGHQQCRCSRAPLTKSWRDLGFDVDEPRSIVRDGHEEFAKLPKKQQLEVMGPTRLQGLDRGLITWDELATKRTNVGWRPAYYATPVREFRRRIPVG
jgi:hypothetical protein